MLKHTFIHIPGIGPTPASRGKEIRATSAVNVFGKVNGDPKVLAIIRDDEELSVIRSQ